MEKIEEHTGGYSSGPTIGIDELWRCSDSAMWENAVRRYWDFVQPRNLELERKLDELDIGRLQRLDAQGWYHFLHDEYFRWKYTAPNRYATTISHLRKYITRGELKELDAIRQQILNLDADDVRLALKTAEKIRGLGTAGASGLLSLIYPHRFATVDQFVVKALREIKNLPEAKALFKMNPENLTIADGVFLIDILKRKAEENNQVFGASAWTPRKIDMVLWTFGR